MLIVHIDIMKPDYITKFDVKKKVLSFLIVATGRGRTSPSIYSKS